VKRSFRAQGERDPTALSRFGVATIPRTSLGFAASTSIVNRRNCDPIHENSGRTTMGIGDLKSLTGFLRAARGGSQERIIVTFLDVVINVEELVDNGSVLINHPRREKLVLFNEGDFIFQKKLLDPS
jgi:hypothetical protein